MSDSKCSFVATLIKQDFSCEMAELVTRRAGPDISCTSDAASTQCARLYEQFKQSGLPAFDAEDDLLTTPHSVFAKIQFGGLLGLARETDSACKSVDNIYKLVDSALQKYQSIENFNYNDYVEHMINYKTSRKSKRK